ncbi:MAG: DUF2142 domain-containing protein [Actinomycetota bacterium]
MSALDEQAVDEERLAERSITAWWPAVVLVGVLALMWILAVPPSAGPDEPNHLVRGAGLVRWQLDGQSGRGLFEVPPWVGFPDPVCYAFESFTPADCASFADRPTGPDVTLQTRAADYQVWGHLLPGVGTLGPANASPYASRLLDAAIPVALVAGALVAAVRRGWLRASGVLLALTPMAWFVFAVVNPSGVVVAGGVALAAGLFIGGRDPTAGHRWLMAAGWAALTLPRRDGLIWAGVLLSIGLLFVPLGLRQWWRLLGRWPQVVVVVSTVATLAWAARSDTAAAAGLFLVPLLPIGTELLRRGWVSPAMQDRRRRVAAVVIAIPIVVVVLYGAMALRPGGFDRDVLRIVVGQTGLHLEEAIGLLGWLDAPVPVSMVLLWLAGLGVLVGAALFVDARSALGAAAVTLAVAIVASWVLEMVQGDPTGTYWQGRYYLPLLVAAPIALSSAGDDRSPELRRVGRVVGIVGLVVANVALAAAMRRWGVGIAGPMVPWSWDTYNAPIPPVAILGAHAAASAGLWWWIDRASVPDPTALRP